MENTQTNPQPAQVTFFEGQLSDDIWANEIANDESLKNDAQVYLIVPPISFN